MTDLIHPLRLTEPRTRAGKSMTLAALALRIALQGRKINILDPREAHSKPIELPAASEQGGGVQPCPACGSPQSPHNHMPGQLLDREEAARLAASLAAQGDEGEGSGDA